MQLEDARLIPYRNLRVASHTAVTKIKNAHIMTFSKSVYDIDDSELTDPNSKPCVFFVAGVGSKAAGLKPHRWYFATNEHLYERISNRDIGRSGAMGLKLKNKSGLHLFVRPVKFPQEVKEAIGLALNFKCA